MITAAASRPSAAERVEMPPRAPRAAVAQDVGLTRVSVEYRSPAVHGRRIWGARVPFGEPWLSGDSPHATIAFSRDVKIGGKTLSAGSYAIIATPAPTTWTIAFERVHAPGDGVTESSPVRVEVPAERGDARERLRFSFSTFTTSAARLDLEWERVRVSVPIAVDTNAQILSAIADLDRHDAALGSDYERAGRFLLSRTDGKKGGETDREKGRAYLERAAALETRVDTIAASALSPRELPAPAERKALPAMKATHAPGADEIGSVITKGRPAIEVCYQRALRRDPSLGHGKITVSITVGASGRVKSVEVDAPEALRPVEACVKAAVSRWAFPPSPETYATELPLVLEHRD